MKSIIVGTAGHIDHGKTALVRALTGIDADRLPEEKRRGITIDIGFADLDLDGTADLPAEGTAARFPGSVPWSGYASFELGQGRTLSASGFPLGAHQRAEVTLRADGTASAGGVVRITDHRGTVYDLEVRPTGAVHLSRSYGV